MDGVNPFILSPFVVELSDWHQNPVIFGSRFVIYRSKLFQSQFIALSTESFAASKCDQVDIGREDHGMYICSGEVGFRGGNTSLPL